MFSRGNFVCLLKISDRGEHSTRTRFLFNVTSVSPYNVFVSMMESKNKFHMLFYQNNSGGHILTVSVR